MNRFNECLPITLQHEGGYVNHPRDPGGATNRGITNNTYMTWRRSKGKKAHHVTFITEEEVAAIYKEMYWDYARCHWCPPGLDLVVFDAAVNSGPKRSIKWMQRAIGGLKVDGRFGPNTLEAVSNLSSNDVPVVINKALDLRLGFLRSLRHWPTFGKGWTRRVAETREKALDAVKGQGIPVSKTPRPSLFDFTADILQIIFERK